MSLWLAITGFNGFCIFFNLQEFRIGTLLISVRLISVTKTRNFEAWLDKPPLIVVTFRHDPRLSVPRDSTTKED